MPVRDLARKLLITAMLIALYRIGAVIPLPTVRPVALEFIGTTRYSAIWQQFGGNPLSSVSVLALGVVPYVTGSIVLQLLGTVLPGLARLQESAEGQAKARRITRAVSLAIAVVQAIVTVIVFKRSRPMIGVTITEGWVSATLTVVLLTAGFVAVTLIADAITRHGVGSGISVILLVTLLSALGSQLSRALPLMDPSEILWSALIATSGTLIGVVGLRSYQRIVVNSTELQLTARRSATELRARILQGGIAPMVFASSILGLLTSVAARNDALKGALSDTGAIHAVLFAVLVAGFVRLNQRVTLDPVTTANELVAAGYFIRGRRPGWETANSLSGLANVAALAIASLLIPMTLLPSIGREASAGVSTLLPASSILLLVSVLVEVLREIETGKHDRCSTPLVETSGYPADPWR